MQSRRVRFLRATMNPLVRALALLPAFLALVLSFVVFAPSHAQAGTLNLTEPPAQSDLASYTSFRCEADNQLDVADVLNREFLPLPGGRATFGYRADTCWFRFRIHNTSAAAIELILLADFGLLDHVALYVPEADGYSVTRLGDAEPYGSRPIRTRLNAFPLHLVAGDEKEYLLSASSINTLYVPLFIAGKDQFLESQMPRQWLIGAFYGIGMGLALYNLLLWFSLRERANLIYVAYAALTMLIFAGWHGLYQQFWPDSPNFNNVAHQNFVLLAMLASMFLMREYLDTRSWPLAERLGTVVFVGVLLCILAQIFVPFAWVTRLQGVVAVTVVALSLGLGIARWRQGLAAARTYVLAWALFMLAVVWVVLATYNVTGWSGHLVEGLQAAVVVQQVMLAWGLAQRLNALKRDADKRERAAARVQAENAAKTDFLARMSHEIRTPMNAVIGIAQLLRDDPPPHVRRDYVEVLDSAGRSLLEVINDILDYSRLSAGKIRLEDAAFDLHALIDQAVAIVSPVARQKDLAVGCERTEDVPCWVRGDAARLRQVLLNLLGNAVKFTDRGEVLLRARCNERDGSELCFDVEDTGIGIAPEQRERLFDSFEQGDSSTSRLYGGSGLGLAISQELAQLMGGRIEVRSEPGRGSTFTVCVKLAPSAPPVAAEPVNMPAAQLAGLRVLVAEDNSVNRLVIDGMLQRLGIVPVLVGNGEEALRTVADQPGAFDLLLMDCEMPRMDGYTAARRIRELERNQQRARLPIVALTAHVLADSRERCIDAGMDDHLGKPLTQDQLLASLQRWGKRVT